MGLKSWLDKFGNELKKIVTDVGKVEAKAKPIVEELVPASTPIFDVFDIGVEIAKDVQAAFAAADQANEGPAMLAAALPGLSAALDQYTLAKFPGSQAILTSEKYLASKPKLMNAIVEYINSMPDSLDVTPTRSAIVAASAVSAALKAAAPTAA